ncbi:MAG: hypothetical protein P8100_13835 [bacterium]|jgi:hypothetical protein
MKSILWSTVILVFLFAACQNQSDKSQSAPIEEIGTEKAVDVDLANFEEEANLLVGKQVVLNGMVDHVCKHGGQKLFLVNQDADARVKITTGENMAAFNTELEGETVRVVGIVEEQRIDEDYLREWEEEITGGPIEGENSQHGEKVHMGEHNQEMEAEAEENPEMRQINNYREMIQESGKDYISFFSVTCVEYEVLNTNAEVGV